MKKKGDAFNGGIEHVIIESGGKGENELVVGGGGRL